MAFPDDQQDRLAIRKLVKMINEAWLRGHPEELEEYFHDDVVIVPPGFQVRARGKEACVASYKEFVLHATIREYKESHADIDLWGDTAVATYFWELAYEMNGEPFRESGWDLFVFVRDKEKWYAVWRTMVPSPSKGAQ